MKSHLRNWLIALLCTPCLCLSAHAEQAFINAPLKTEPEIKYGIEALTTWRSEYVHRGFQLAENAMEFQLAGQVALNNNDTLDLGLFYGTATSDGDFSESGAFIDFSRNIGDLTYSAILTLRDYSNSNLKSGTDIGAGINWILNDRIDISGLLSYNTGAEGFYLEGKISYYLPINDDTFFTLDTGISAVSNYYQRDGVNHAFARAELTYNINDSVSLSPYLEINLGIDDLASDHILAGAYFAVSF